MPDIDFQKIELNLIPKKGEQPIVFYASQYETARPFIAALKWGDSEFAPGVDCWAEIDIRKNDDNLVVITDDVSIDNNEVSVVLPVQALTCIGKNLGQVKIYSSDDHLIAALNFILEVQADPLAGGVTSETAIDNLTQQIEDIATEVIGEDYYNKTETDALLADKADKSELPDMTDYYTKTQTDNLLNDKADITDLATLASKAEVTQAISDEDTAVKNWVSSNFATPGYVASHYYDKAEIDNLIDNIYPTLSASGAIANFKTALSKPLVSVTTEVGATTVTRCGKNLFDNSNFPSGFGSIVATYNLDGTVTLNGTASGNEYFNIPIDLPNNNYVLSVGNTSADANVHVSFVNHNSEFYGDNDFSTTSKVINISGDISAIVFYVLSGTTLTDFTIKPMLEFGTIATDFEAYNAETVPVADATTLNTLSGVNNVFADTGSVTVQYKYMSI